MKQLATFSIACILMTTISATAQDVVRQVKLVTLSQSGSNLERRFFARVAARQTVDLAFQVSGQLKEFPVVEGSIVPEGDLIAQLDLEPFNLALQEAQLRQEQASRAVARLEQLSRNAVSQASVDDAGTQSQLADVALRNAEYSLERATLSAPFDALVATRNIANFTTINAGQPVVRLHDMSELRIEINVPEVLFQRAGQNGDGVQLSVRFPASDTDFPLELREFNAETSSVGQTFLISLGLEPPEGMVILPGSSAVVTAKLPLSVSALRVPPSAIVVDENGKTFVMRYSANGDSGTVEKIEVELQAGGNGEMRAVEGVSPGDMIVVAGASELESGQTVAPFTGFEN